MRLRVEGLIQLTFPSFRELEFRHVTVPANKPDTFVHPHLIKASGPLPVSFSRIHSVVLRFIRIHGPLLLDEDFKPTGRREVFDLWIGRIESYVYYAYGVTTQ